jgi:hypothetical protein
MNITFRITKLKNFEKKEKKGKKSRKVKKSGKWQCSVGQGDDVVVFGK